MDCDPSTVSVHGSSGRWLYYHWRHSLLQAVLRVMVFKGSTSAVVELPVVDWCIQWLWTRCTYPVTPDVHLRRAHVCYASCSTVYGQVVRACIPSSYRYCTPPRVYPLWGYLGYLGYRWAIPLYLAGVIWLYLVYWVQVPPDTHIGVDTSIACSTHV